MMKQEFEALAGYEVSFEDYNNIIEPMYMASNLSKADFVQTINKKRFALKNLKVMIKEMKALAKEIEEQCTHVYTYDLQEQLRDIAREYVSRKYGSFATFNTHEEMKQSCYYIKSIEIFGTKNYKTFETINLI